MFVALLIDIIDIMVMFVAPDCVKFKSTSDMISALFKLLAFGAVNVGGTRYFYAKFIEAGCMNAEGTQVLSNLQLIYDMFCVLSVFSGVCSAVEGPLSALDGHSLSLAKPYVKSSF
jgi:hypothetical protein